MRLCFGRARENGGGEVNPWVENGVISLTNVTGRHFVCACVHPLNDNSVGTSNLMAGNGKLALSYNPLNTVLSSKK